MDELLDRFLEYISFDTQSRAGVKQTPSSSGQWDLLHLLQQQLTELGLTHIRLSPRGILTATLPANIGHKVPTVGFIAHVDTAPDYTGKKVCPQIIETYRGGDIALGTGDEVLSPVMFPVMHQLLGQTLITTDGKTLLGADDKAGIAEIITALHVLKHQRIPHGDIRVAFTPDEEIGRGADYFDVAGFNADWAYTVDGGGLGELEYENFNAAEVKIELVGNAVHPGSAKGVMVNALALAAHFHAQLPADETPECTDRDQGFYHLCCLKGCVEHAEMRYLIRDFDNEKFEQRKQKMVEIARRTGEDLPAKCYIELKIKDSYYNMRDKVLNHPYALNIARQAMTDCGIEPIMKPVRGGTDGAKLAFKGLPCPNLFTGGHNFHSKHEMITLDAMEQAVKVIVQIARRVSELPAKS